MSCENQTENTGIKVNVDLRLPETVEAVQKVIPRTLAAIDQVGASIVTTVGLPFLVTNEISRHYLDKTKEKLAKKLEAIPENQLHPPKAYMANPLLQDMFSYMDNDSLHDLFVNLLASSMEASKDTLVHPAFVSVIKNLSPLDAAALTSARFRGIMFPVYSVMFQGKSTAHDLSQTVPFPFKHPSTGSELFSHVMNLSDVNIDSHVQGINKILDNLIRQGIIETDKTQFLTSPVNYQEDIPFLWQIKKEIEDNLPKDAPQEREVAIIPSLGRVTSFGQDFLHACVY